MRRSTPLWAALLATAALSGAGSTWAQCSALSDPNAPECNKGAQALSSTLSAAQLPAQAVATPAATAAAMVQGLPSISINKTNNHYTLNNQDIQNIQNISNVTNIQQMQAMQGVPAGVNAQDYNRALNTGIEAATMGMKVQADVIQRMGIMNSLMTGK